ncbi:MAG: NUDIX domain-containing protein [Patescibacteria group bacterium]
MKILSLLLFKPGARFKELNIDSLGTDDFSYHVRCLLAEGFIVKERYSYSLSSKGKMLAGKIDTNTHTLEKQPKVGVLVIPHMKFGKEEKFLIQQRTKEPYFGYWGFMTGKVRFGETLEMTAGREMEEEAGMRGKFKLCYELHEMVYDKNTMEQLEDKFFHVVEAYDLEGDIADKTQEGNNGFYTVEEFRKLSPNTTMRTIF